MPNQDHSICPRCDSATTELQFKSPVEGVWEIYRCTTCLFSWRTSEPVTITAPEKFDPLFKVKPEDLPGFPEMPGIPPLRNKA